ncbi:hypothetical protein J2S43_008388 [Catenuloplanes nepalensis]|uniref:Uncharacterized protein n=1 Tax=Catenuloplanes nepalensis TaxID=587533 RepID=A0ABT9N8Z3_9ACTN|nr:hypothetical protein [Catenuloplanes nepalensis]MDP9799876.1 hypothetical protein [Catenuloplanes nepalensis]
MTDQTQSWAERTVPVPPDMHPPASDPGYDDDPTRLNFQRGRASVAPRASRHHDNHDHEIAPHEPTGTGWPDSPPPPPAVPFGVQLRRGREWGVLGLIFSFVCWGIWAISDGGSFLGAFLTYVVTLVVAVGLFALARLVGRLVLERQLHRVRRSARGSYLIVGAFLIAVGIAYLSQTGWVVDVWGWIKANFY